MNILSDSDLLVIRIVDGQPVDYPLTYSNFRLINPQTSFPELPDNSFLVDYGFYRFQYVNKPVPPPFTNVTDGPFALDPVRDAWVNTYVETPFTPEEMDAARQQQTDLLRGERDRRLYMCDWTQLPDVPLTAEQVEAWRTYRQQLRDYMGTVTDPFNPPAWPVPPAS
jgi:hypothetical protein